jgi:hypothetical protein
VLLSLLPLSGIGLVTGCSGEPAGPVAATLEIGLSTPFQDDGAVLFTIAGGPVDSLEAPGYSVYSSRPDPTTLQVIITGDLTSGMIARIHIPDERMASRYLATLNQAAARASYAQRDPASYALAVGLPQ